MAKPTPTSRAPLLFLFALALASLWPVLQNLHAFRTLFYFEDEWDLIDLWDKTGFTSWVGTVFAENFVPLFKAAWGGAIVAFGGSYFALVLLLWLTHAANVFLLSRIATRLGANWGGTALAGLIFGLAWINFETLGWTVQWSAVLSLFFLLLALDALAGRTAVTGPGCVRLALLLGGCALASALCFSRGVLTGIVLACWALLATDLPVRRFGRAGIAALAVLPSLGVAWWIFSHSTGNHLHVAGQLGSMLTFAYYYYAESPLRLLFSNETPHWAVIALLALGKTALFGAGLTLAPRRSRTILLILIAFEIGNALLLGLGRHHTGLAAAGSSRYQYGALAALLPFVAILFDRAMAWLPVRLGLRGFVTAVFLGIIAWRVQAPWRDTMDGWSHWRGGDLRQALFETPPAQAPEHFTRLPWMSNERARELAAKYHLH